jgi:hypothetical protein
MDLKEILNQLKIKNIYLNLVDWDKEDYYNREVEIPLTIEELIKILEDEVIQDILKKKFDFICISLEYPNIPISNELKEKIKNNKVGEKIEKEIEMEYWEKKKKRKIKKVKKLKITKIKDLVKSLIDEEFFGIIMYGFNKNNLIECVNNLLNILKEGGDN